MELTSWPEEEEEVLVLMLKQTWKL